MSLRQDYDAGREFDLAGDSRCVSQRDQWVRNRDLVASRHLSVLRSRIGHMRFRDHDVLDGPDRIESDLLRLARQLSEKFRLREWARIGEYDACLHFVHRPLHAALQVRDYLVAELIEYARQVLLVEARWRHDDARDSDILKFLDGIE